MTGGYFFMRKIFSYAKSMTTAIAVDMQSRTDAINIGYLKL